MFMQTILAIADVCCLAGCLGQLLAAWQTEGGDLNGDGTTNGADLGMLLASWGVCR